MASVLSEEQFRCSICLDIFKNPVSTPCGHNFCKRCIKRYWDSRHKSQCPLCKQTFKTRPELTTNINLKDITETFKSSLKEKVTYKPAPLKRQNPRLSKSLSSSDEVFCDTCAGNNIRAVKSCLVCRASYCEVHLVPHLRDQALITHTLTDPGTFTTSHVCQKHNMLLEMFCKKDQVLVCAKCIDRDHKHHEIITIEKETRRIKAEMRKAEAEFQQMIQDRLRKTEQIKDAVELSKTVKENNIKTTVEVYTEVISATERHQAALIEEIEQKQEAAEKKAEDLLKELSSEINELQRRRNDLLHLELSDDPIDLFQSYPSLSPPLSTRDWSKVTIQSNNSMGSVRRVFTKLVDVCRELEKKLSAEEVSKMTQYADDVTLDPLTAAAWLVLSPDGKKVSLGFHPRKTATADEPRRFDSCVSVLGKQSFTTGRHYWVVQVGDKTDWDLGVAKESINRKGVITVRPDCGYWAICRRKGGNLNACTGPSIPLHLSEIPQKVGIFLDYEEGMVSFYNAEAKTHIYTYSGLIFMEPLYAYLNPCLHDNGRNIAPLNICPVEVEVPEEAARM
ncbi:E3 ubiquitin-protein ligase TRIM39-like [Sphaeramia orbicularis]|uniref:E3 ubiquitin-protein ligase TRIM39-like n=1 Tax=Sphaeramia orbicularis TaxID=375764 RepID=A0A673BVI7_9TELE|nr:E3 ubiquitin-protein ligase TRIM39-like [Sphaeramia orbicularis]